MAKKVSDADIRRAMEQHGWNVTAVSEALPLDRKHLYERLLSMGIGPSKLAERRALRADSSPLRSGPPRGPVAQGHVSDSSSVALTATGGERTFPAMAAMASPIVAAGTKPRWAPKMPEDITRMFREAEARLILRGHSNADKDVLLFEFLRECFPKWEAGIPMEALLPDKEEK